MLEQMRKRAKYFYFLFALIIVSFVFWGVGPDQNGSGVQALAKVGDYTVSTQEYWRAYGNMEDLYRDVYKEEFDEAKREELRQTVLNNLINNRLFLIAADEAGIRVSDEELEEAIMNEPSFNREGAFSSQIYQNTLRLSRLTPAGYEAIKRQELVVAKMMALVEATVDLSPGEWEGMSGDEQILKTLKEAMLEQKKQAAYQSFIEALKRRIPVTVNEELIT
jgi:peptidyl-prolyl cis-trans isomerase D